MTHSQCLRHTGLGRNGLTDSLGTSQAQDRGCSPGGGDLSLAKLAEGAMRLGDGQGCSSSPGVFCP